MGRDTRKLENAKQANIADINFYPSQVKEGELLFALPHNKMLRMYKKIRGMLWWTNLTRNGDIIVDRDLNIKRNLTLKGHKKSQTFMVNAFQYPAPGTDWTPAITGAVLSGVSAAKKCWLPLNFLKIGDEIVSYKIVGALVETVAGCTFNCKLVRVNLADPITTTDITGGGITQVTANGNFDVLATLSSIEIIATDKQYLLEIVASLEEAADFAYVMGAEVKVNRK